MTRTRHPRPAYSLLELVVALAILGLLAGLGLAGVQKARDAAARQESRNNLRQMALALHAFEAAHGRLPPLAGGWGSPAFRTTYGPVHVFLLPHLEQEPLARSMDRGDRSFAWWTGSPAGSNPYARTVRVFYSPSDGSIPGGFNARAGWGATSYAANAMLFAATDGNGSMEGWDAARPLANVRDGTSNTLAFTEKIGDCEVQPYGGGSLWGVQWDPWYPVVFGSSVNGGEPYVDGDDGLLPQFSATRTNCHPFGPSTPHAAAIQAAMADGSVRDVTARASAAAWWRAAHPADGGVPGADW